MIEVETYEVEEINASEASAMAADAASIELAEKLGLKGQLSLTNVETLTRNPYREATALELLVFETLFPEKTRVEAYKGGIIPLRVLQVLAHAKECDQFKRFMVWHPLNAADKDPVLVGATKEDYWMTDDRIFLLARWGDGLLPFEELAAKAKRIWIAKSRQLLNEAAASVNSHLAQLESKAEEIFLTGKAANFSWSGW